MAESLFNKERNLGDGEGQRKELGSLATDVTVVAGETIEFREKLIRPTQVPRRVSN